MGKSSVSLKNPDVDKAYNAALRQLARQDRTRKELLDKLKRWYTEEATQAAV